MAFHAKYQSTIDSAGEAWTVTIYYDTGSAPTITTLDIQPNVNLAWDHTGNASGIGIMPSYCRLRYLDPDAVLYDDLLASSDEALWRVEISRTGAKWRGFVQLATTRRVLGTMMNITEVYAYCGLAKLSDVQGLQVGISTQRQVFEQVKYILSDSLLSDTSTDPDIFLATEYVPDNMDTSAGTWANNIRIYQDWNRPLGSNRNDAKTDLNALCGMRDAVVWQGLDGWHFESVNQVGQVIPDYHLNKYDLSAGTLAGEVRASAIETVTDIDIQDGSKLWVLQRVGNIIIKSETNGQTTLESELPNGDFEYWSGATAVGWSGVYSQTTKKNNGTYAVQISAGNSIGRFGVVVSKDVAVFPALAFYYAGQYTVGGTGNAMFEYKVKIHGLDGSTWYFASSGGWTKTDSSRLLLIDSIFIAPEPDTSVTYFQETLNVDAYDIPVSGYMEFIFFGNDSIDIRAFYDDITVTLVDTSSAILANTEQIFDVNDNGQSISVTLSPRNIHSTTVNYIEAYDGSAWNESAGVDGDGKPNQYMIASNIKARMLTDTSALDGRVNKVLPPERPISYNSVKMLAKRININLSDSTTTGEWRGYL